MTAAPARVVEMPDGSVVIPPALASSLRGWLVRQLVEGMRDGGTPSATARQLVFALDRAQAHSDFGTSDIGTVPSGQPTMERGEWITAGQAASDMGCSVEWVRSLARSGAIEGRRIGRAWLISRSSLDAFRHGTTEAS